MKIWQNTLFAQLVQRRNNPNVLGSNSIVEKLRTTAARGYIFLTQGDLRFDKPMQYLLSYGNIRRKSLRSFHVADENTISHTKRSSNKQWEINFKRSLNTAILQFYSNDNIFKTKTVHKYIINVKRKTNCTEY